MSYVPVKRSAWSGYSPTTGAPYLALEPEEMLTQIRRRDWGTIINDLISARVSLSEIARRTGRDQTTVMHWRDEGDPKDVDARKVLALHRKHCQHRYNGSNTK